jgi:hypothetical protein
MQTSTSYQTIHEGEECSLVLEHVFDPFPLEKQKQTDLSFFYHDDLELWSRHNIRVERGSSDQIATLVGVLVVMPSAQTDFRRS